MLVCWSTARIATDPYGDGLFDKMEHFQIAYEGTSSGLRRTQKSQELNRSILKWARLILGHSKIRYSKYIIHFVK